MKKNIYSILAAVIGVLILFLFGIIHFLPRPLINVEERVPEIVSIGNVPELQSYVMEFSKPAAREPVVTVSERKEPFIPVDHDLVQGKVISVDHNTNCSLWVIQSYKGSNWWEQQKLYFYSDSSRELEEITAFSGKQIYRPVVLSTGNSNAFILAPVWTNDKYGYYSESTHELWAFQIKSKDTRQICIGHDVNVSPDHSKSIFLRSSKDNLMLGGGGFHCVYLWDVQRSHNGANHFCVGIRSRIRKELEL